MKNFDTCLHNNEHNETVKKAKQEMFSTNLINDISNLLKILGEPSRLKVVLALSKGEMCVNHIVEACESNQSLISHQLRILKDNKIVKSRRDGQSIVYSLDDEHIMQIVSLVKTHVEE